MISNCGHDENGKYSGGKAGDQTGTEWQVRTWYNRPWNYVLRYPDTKVANEISRLATDAANNENIGYDQADRYTFWDQLKKCGYEPSKIKTPCEADCSSGVAAIVKAVGYLKNIKALQGVSIYLYTGNIRAGLKNAGFQVITDPKYLNSDNYLLPGDILLCEGHHVATNISTGKNAVASKPSNPTSTAKPTPAPSSFARTDYSKVTVSLSTAMSKTMIYDAQVHLNNFLSIALTLDGDRGANTKKAIVKAFQQALNIDYNAKLEIDGIPGPKFKAALKGKVVKGGKVQYLVTAVQIALLAKGYNPKGVESPGSCGNGCVAAIVAYQEAHRGDGLLLDGEAGYNTIMLLIS